MNNKELTWVDYCNVCKERTETNLKSLKCVKCKSSKY
jgi:hypothetical protein